MPALGSNINAALGRIDYSPIARGGESMARGIAQAGQVKGQTYASIGQNISQGIQKYQKNQKILISSGFILAHAICLKKLLKTPDWLMR